MPLVKEAFLKFLTAINFSSCSSRFIKAYTLNVLIGFSENNWIG